jgi:hypothetical protein
VKRTMLVALFFLPLLSHAQSSISEGVYRRLNNFNWDAQGKLHQFPSEVRRIDSMTPNEDGESMDVLMDNRETRSGNDFHSGQKLTTVEADNYLLRRIPVKSRREAEHIVIERVTKRLNVSKNGAAAFEVAGEGGADIIQMRDIKPGNDRFYSKNQIIEALHGISPDVKVEIPWPTLHKLVEEGIIFKTHPESRKLLADLVTDLQKRPNAAEFAERAGKSLYGLTIDHDKEFANLLEKPKAALEKTSVKASSEAVAREAAHESVKAAGAAR